MGFFTDLLGGSKDPKPFGGGFDPAIKPYIEEGLGGLQAAYQQGPLVYPGEMVAGFTPAQLQAQSSLLALATGQPGYYQPALTKLEDIYGMTQAAATPITAEEIAKQRELLEPIGEAQRFAQQQGFEKALRNIGLGAGGAGVGALEGARADILRGGAAGELALGLAGIEGELQKAALQQAEADRLRQTTGATQMAELVAQGLGISKSEFEEQLGRIQLGADVGLQQQLLEQAMLDAEMAKFYKEDPFALAQQYLQTIYGAPTMQMQYTQEPSTFQEIVGLGTIGSSFFKNEGGQVNRQNGGGILSKLKAAYDKARGNTTGIFSEEEEDEIREIEDFSDEMFGTDYASEREKKQRKPIDPSQAMAMVGSRTITPNDSVMFAKQRAARQALGMRKNGGGIASLQTGSSPSLQGGSSFSSGNIPRNINELTRGLNDPEVLRRVQQQAGLTPVSTSNEPNAFQRILSGVGSGLRSIGSGIKTGAEYYAENLDPFGPAGANLSKEERIRVGLGILAAQPQLGESPLITTARGALMGFASVDDLDDGTITPRTSTVPNSEYEVIDEAVFKLQKTSTKIDADKRISLRREAEREAIAGIRVGTVANDPASYRTEVLERYEDKLKEAYKKPVEEGGFKKPQDKGSASQAIDTASGIASMTPKGKK